MSNKTPSNSAPSTQLYLVDAGQNDVGQLAPALNALIDALPIAAVLLAGNRSQDDVPALRDLIAATQQRGVATLISDNVDLAQATKADGLHLSWRSSIVSDYSAARQSLGDDAMIGADAGKSRHDSTILAEAGANYVAFGVPPHVKDKETARTRQHNLIAWWATVVVIPVVAFDIETPDQTAELIKVGADFVAVTLPPLSGDQATLARWIADFSPLFPTETQTS